MFKPFTVGLPHVQLDCKLLEGRGHVHGSHGRSCLSTRLHRAYWVFSTPETATVISPLHRRGGWSWLARVVHPRFTKAEWMQARGVWLQSLVLKPPPCLLCGVHPRNSHRCASVSSCSGSQCGMEGKGWSQPWRYSWAVSEGKDVFRCSFFPPLISKFFTNSGYKILLVICIRAIISVSGSLFYFNVVF